MVGTDGSLYRFTGLRKQGNSGTDHLCWDVLQIATNSDVITHGAHLAKSVFTHTAMVSQAGVLYTYGDGRHGQLGQDEDDFDAKYYPRALSRNVFGGQKVCGVSCGRNFTVAVTGVGEVFTFGHNDVGQLGIGTNTPGDCQKIQNPRRVETLIGKCIVMVASGCQHTVCVCAKGKVFSWGKNSFGQLGLGNCEDVNSHTPMEVLRFGTHDKKAVLVSAGDMHSAVVTRQGNMYTFGHNRWGQLGLPRDKTHVCIPTLIAAPCLHSIPHSQQRIDETLVWTPPSSIDGGIVGPGDEQEEIVTTIHCSEQHTVATSDIGALFIYGPALQPRTKGAEIEIEFIRIHESFFGNDKIVAVSMTAEHELLSMTSLGFVYIWDGIGLPLVLEEQYFDFGKVGPYARIHPSHALAFAMVTHMRIGNQCILTSMPDELIRRIIDTCGMPMLAQTEGHSRQLGGQLGDWM